MDAVASLERLLASQEVTFGKHDAELVRTLVKIGHASVEARAYSKAEAAFWRAVEILCKIHGEHHIDVLFCIEQLVAISEAQNNDLQADRLKQQAEGIRKNLRPPKPGAPPLRSALAGPQSATPPPKAVQAAPNTAVPPAKSIVPAPASTAQPPSPAQQTPSNSIPKFTAPQTPLAARVQESTVQIQLSDLPVTNPTAGAGTANCRHGLHPAACEVCVMLQSASGKHLLAQTMAGTPMSAGQLISALVVKSSGQRIAIGSDIVWIGQDPINDVSLPKDPQVARSHAVVELVKGQYWIRQCSASPTTLNGREVSGKASLCPGDTIVVGSTEIRVE